MGTTAKIARFVVDTDYSAIPEEAVRVAKDAIRDCLGVALAGAAEPAGRIIAEHVREEGGAPQASVIGHDFKTSAPQAALANGTMAHALDYDDVLWTMSGHPTVPVLPVVLALAEMNYRSGQDLLEAYIIGVEVEARIGAGIGPHHYAVGWHPTATLGTLGAAAAAARMLGLGVTATQMALGIAASEASGLRQNFGTMTKPFHAGNAARSGLVAALLAQKGFTADEDILGNPYGFAPVLGGDGEYNLTLMTEHLGDPFALVEPGLDMKPYPCCRFIHRCIDAVLQIVAEHHPEPEEVAAVECQTGPLVPQIVIHHRPKTTLEGKFSMEYCMARALLDSEMGMAQFSEDKVLDGRAQQLLQKVRYVHPDGWAEDFPEVVTVTMRDGQRYSREVLHARGSPENPMSGDELRAKYRDCARIVLTEKATEQSLEMLSRLEDFEDVAPLTNLLTASGRPVVADPRK